MSAEKSWKAQYLPVYLEMVVAYVSLFGFALDERAKPNVDADEVSTPALQPTNNGYRLSQRLSLLGM